MLHLVGDALEMLDVHGRDDIDSGVKEFQNILPAFVVPAGSRHVGVGKLVNQGDLGLSSQDRVLVHLVKPGSPVLDRLAGDDFEALDHVFGEPAPVALYKADDHISAALTSTPALAEHGVGLADARGRAEVDAEMTSRLDGVGSARFYYGGRAHAFIGPPRAGGACLLGDFDGLPPESSRFCQRQARGSVRHRGFGALTGYYHSGSGSQRSSRRTCRSFCSAGHRSVWASH